MRTLVGTLLIAGLWLMGIAGQAVATEKATQQRSKLSTNMNFEDLLIQGKYHFSDEAVSTVEEDKVLDALLGIRKDFKDRIKRSASRY